MIYVYICVFIYMHTYMYVYVCMYEMEFTDVRNAMYKCM